MNATKASDHKATYIGIQYPFKVTNIDFHGPGEKIS